MINSLREAMNPAIEVINSNLQTDRIKSVTLFNKDRHMLLTSGKGLKYWLLFKRELFKSFGKIFNYSGPGDSINQEWVTRALKENIAAFVFVYKQGSVYIIPPNELKEFAVMNETIRNTLSGERTMSFPVSFLRRWKA